MGIIKPLSESAVRDLARAIFDASDGTTNDATMLYAHLVAGPTDEVMIQNQTRVLYALESICRDNEHVTLSE